MSTGDKPKPGPHGKKPTVLQVQPLGHPVQLGELYDQRSGQFLGLQLYPEENLNIIDTDVKHTDLSVSLSTSLEDKVSVLQIDASASLSILCGLISISGSATYVKDVRSNMRQQAYALALKMRLNERRILFAEDGMGRNVLDVARTDYVRTGSATHFASSITYGGNLIVNLVARQYKFSAEERLEGSLGWIVDKLKGSVRLSEASVDIGDELKGVNDKFDLVVHGDVALERIPNTPQDVLDTFPTAASLIQRDGGIPILVTLQPIPSALVTLANLVYEIDKLLEEQILKSFALLDDLRSRFSVLVDSIKGFAELVPELARTARIVSDQYAKDHGSLLYELRKFLDDYQHGRPLPPRFEGEKKDDGSYDIPVLKDVTRLYEFHLKLDDTSHQPSQHYPSTLVGLEEEFLKFRDFVLDIQRLRDSVLPLVKSRKRYVRLSSIDKVTTATMHQNTIPLFVMTCFTAKQPGKPTEDKLHPALSIVRFFNILRTQFAYFNDPSATAHILYAETPEILKRRPPNLEKYSGREDPFFIIGRVDPKGQLSWSDPPQTTALSLKLCHKSSGPKRGDLTYSIEAVNGMEPFSVQIWAKPSSLNSPNNSTICLLRSTTGIPFLEFRIQPLDVKIKGYQDETVIRSRKDPPKNAVFVATFVQDFKTADGPKWSLYIGEEEVGHESFEGRKKLLPESTNVELAFPDNVAWWNGEVYQVRAFSYALTKERITEEVKKASAT